MSIFEIEIKEGMYTLGQLNIIKIWENKIKSFKTCGIDTGYVLFQKPATNAKSNKRRLCGFECDLVSYTNNGMEMVKMKNDKFILLMAKIGIDIDLSEVRK